MNNNLGYSMGDLRRSGICSPFSRRRLPYWELPVLRFPRYIGVTLRPGSFLGQVPLLSCLVSSSPLQAAQTA